LAQSEPTGGRCGPYQLRRPAAGPRAQKRQSAPIRPAFKTRKWWMIVPRTFEALHRRQPQLRRGACAISYERRPLLNQFRREQKRSPLMNGMRTTGFRVLRWRVKIKNLNYSRAEGCSAERLAAHRLSVRGSPIWIRRDYRRAALSRPNARSTAPSRALWTTNAIAMLPTNVAPITIASIVLSAPEFNISFHPRRPQFCLLLICAQATTERCSPESTGLFEDSG
jgi:hypothetical protein